jgi:hypothetical protein
MDARDALSDLVDVSPGLEAAVALEASGGIRGSTLADDEGARVVADAALDLLREATRLRDGAEAVEVVAVTKAGALAVARRGDLVVAAVTEPDPPVRLALHDLGTCLDTLGAEGDERGAG